MTLFKYNISGNCIIPQFLKIAVASSIHVSISKNKMASERVPFYFYSERGNQNENGKEP